MSIRSLRWLWLLALIPVVAGLARLRFDADVLNLLPDEVPAVRGLKLYQQHFANARELMVSIRAPEPELAESAARTLAESLRNATGVVARAIWQAPWLEQPEQSAELIAYLWLNQPTNAFGELANCLAGTNAIATLESTRQQLATSMSPSELGRLSYDPFQLMSLPEESDDSPMGFGGGDEVFASDDGTFRLILVEAAHELPNYRACIRWLQNLEEEIRAWRMQHDFGPEVSVRYAGRPVFMAEIAGSMETDMTRSVLGTMAVIAVLFWGAYRSWRPLLWLLVLLVAILVGTFALGGLILGELNVVSAGFAAILLGLAVDYALVLYQEHRANPHEPARTVQWKLAPSIFWSVATTACAFAVLNWGGLPGLGQLGTLVAVGVLVAGAIMFVAFLPPLIRAEESGRIPVKDTGPPPDPARWLRPPIIWLATAILLASGAFSIWREGIPLDPTADALRPQDSEAHDALAEIRANIGNPMDPVWLIFTGTNAQQVANRLEAAQPALSMAASNNWVSSYTLPAGLWPRPQLQDANRPALRDLIQREDELMRTALAQGFTTHSLALTRRVFETWRAAAESSATYWPTNPMSRWIMNKLTARTDERFYALGLVYPAVERDAGADTDTASDPSPVPVPVQLWGDYLPKQGVWIAGWDQLGKSLLRIVERDLGRVLIPIGLILVVCLWFAFRNFGEVLVSLGTLAFAGLCLLSVMAVANWSWNLLNLMAVPLLLGAGIDYSLHMQLALRRHGGDVVGARRIVGRALLLCAGTTFAGFGSLSLSNNAGLASLGQVCAAGIAVFAITAVFFLPVWWRYLSKHSSVGAGNGSATGPRGSDSTDKNRLKRPSRFYGSGLWQFSRALSKKLSPASARSLARSAAFVYARFNRDRHRIVVQNLLPAFDGDRQRSAAAADLLFANFATKLLDLWRYENGLPIDNLIQGWTGWEHFQKAQSRGNGVLLVTPHLGNWEFGAPLLAKKGVPPLVITMAEPDSELTELRRQSRARWGIETLVVGQDPFSFVEVIRRLESGATVALLIDRPPEPSAVTVQLFGQPFAASIAAAELARAAGCALLPVYLPRGEFGYTAHILPEIAYDRRALGRREERQKLTQKLMDTFEPVIQRYITQWYHFIPMWRDAQPE